MKPSIKQNFLPVSDFKQLQDYCYNTDFKIVDLGNNRLISVLETPTFVQQYLEIPNHKLITSFIRESNDGFDNKPNIHADGSIMGQQAHIARVLYINRQEGVARNGTAFYKHKVHGHKLPEYCDAYEHDRLLTQDANDTTKWEMTQYVINEPNTMLTYSAKLFHSKWPANINRGNRIVMVAFYSLNE